LKYYKINHPAEGRKGHSGVLYKEEENCALYFYATNINDWYPSGYKKIKKLQQIANVKKITKEEVFIEML